MALSPSQRAALAAALAAEKAAEAKASGEAKSEAKAEASKAEKKSTLKDDFDKTKAMLDLQSHLPELSFLWTD